MQFIKAAYRLCDTNEDGCDLCPLNTNPHLCVIDGDVYARVENIEEAVAAVEKWDREHPILTNAMKFKEVFGFEHPHSTACIKEFTPCGWWDDPYEEPGK